MKRCKKRNDRFLESLLEKKENEFNPPPELLFLGVLFGAVLTSVIRRVVEKLPDQEPKFDDCEVVETKPL